MAGQRQKPREELAFKRGGRDSVVDLVPEGERVEAAEPPENMDLCDEAIEVWRMVVPSLTHVTRRELPLLWQWIAWKNLFWQSLRRVERDGPTEFTKEGSKLSSDFRAMREADMMAQRLEAQFGLSPQSRMRLGLAAVQQQTALQRLRGGAERKPPATMAEAVRKARAS